MLSVASLALADHLCVALRQVEERVSEELARERAASVETVKRLSTAMDESLATQSESLEAKLRQVEADVRGAMREADSRAREMNGQLEQAMTSGLALRRCGSPSPWSPPPGASMLTSPSTSTANTRAPGLTKAEKCFTM